MPFVGAFAVFGAGFWTPYQPAGWREVGGVEPVSAFSQPDARQGRGHSPCRFAIPRVYDTPERLLDEARPDFVDNIT